MKLKSLFATICLIASSGFFTYVQAQLKETLVIGITQFPATFHPNYDSMTAKYYVLAMTMRPFTVYDKNWNLVCLLCTELPTIENGLAVLEEYGDGKTGIAVTYTIQPNATWGDGTPVSTRDVEFTISVGKNPESGFQGSEFFKRVRYVEVVDDKTFTLHMDRVEFKYNELGLYLIPAHLEKTIYENTEIKEYRNKTAFDTDTYNPGLYFGPYKVTKVVAGAYIELEANDTWWGKEPQFRKIVVRIVENTAALEANLLSGSIDYISGILGVTLDQALSIRKRHPDEFDFIFRPGLIYEHIDMNFDSPILSDKRVRKALLLATDREAISNQLFQGMQPVADVFASPLDPLYDPNIQKYGYDPDQSRALLEEAGWIAEVEGEIRKNSNGDSLVLEFGTTSGSRVRELVQQVIQGQWREVGIDVRIKNQPARVFFGDTVEKRRFPHLAMYAWLSVPESSPRLTLHSTEIPNEENNYSGSNYIGFKNSEMDRLIDEVEVELDSEKRKPLWARIQQIYTDELPALPLYFRVEPYIIPKWLKGIEPTGNSTTSTHWVEYWHSAN